MNKITRFLLITLFVFTGLMSGPDKLLANNGEMNINSGEKTQLYLFAREDCGFCKLEKEFLNTILEQRNDFEIVYLDVNTPEAKKKFDEVTELYGLVKATPITLVGHSVIQGFDSVAITGSKINTILDEWSGKGLISFDEYFDKESEVFTQTNSSCKGEKDNTSCSLSEEKNLEINVPFIGVVNFKEFSLFSMAVILGFVDGFNPCAMWVLLAFLLVLWQIGDRKKMLQVAGLFVIAEATMYWLILNFWFKTWDFVGLDQVVTPLVGLIAIGGGIYFINRYFKNKDHLTCDITSDEYKTKTENKIRDLIKSPLTIVTALGIIGVAFSINMIEFACSVGIPQTFTKVLEMNNLGLVKEQFYILLYTLFYMVDDFVVFGLALYGFKKFYAVGQKYSNLSSLIGGVLMILLGSLLIFAPDILVF